MSAPPISSIPDAADLHAQLDAINKAITGLQGGAAIINITVGSTFVAPPMLLKVTPPPVYGEEDFVPPITIILEPPITNTTTIDALIDALQIRANDIVEALVAHGYAPS